MSPGWQSRTSHIASSVENRIALTFPVFIFDKLTLAIPILSDNSFSEIFRSAIILSRRKIIDISIVELMNGRTDPPPIKEWRKEFDRLTATKFTLTERYYALQDEVRSVEQLRKGAENIMRDDVQERQPRRHDIEH